MSRQVGAASEMKLSQINSTGAVCVASELSQAGKLLTSRSLSPSHVATSVNGWTSELRESTMDALE